jgi:Cu+-exporting ATPase
MSIIIDKTLCYHCGENCEKDQVFHDSKVFCCLGCKLVFEIIQDNNLCTYYDFNKNPGLKQQSLFGSRFKFLEDLQVQSKLVNYHIKDEIGITFKIPTMHCSSCIWLLENFKKIDKGVKSSNVNFLNKEVIIVYNDKLTSLKNIVEKLAQIGYEPSLHLDSINKVEVKKKNRKRIIQIGVAGFCFGNIMMLSFPEYFSSGKSIDNELKYFFSYLSLFLALPVFFYSASEFFIKSFQALQTKSISIDVPIAVGVAAIFIRSSYEILSNTGVGYFDSGSGLIFFMLIGRWFQDFTFDSLAFDRDYKSYFPISVTSLRNGVEKEIVVSDLKVNDRIFIRNNEIIPVDVLLLNGDACIDYHFVTGESIPVHHYKGETVFAGGRQIGSLIELLVTKELSQSYITQLWSNNFVKSGQNKFENIVHHISKWFIVATLLISFGATAYWWNIDLHRAVNAFTAVLVIACPCALALSAPFTYGNILRILGKNKIFLRDYHTLEFLSDIDHVVFDKTGTLTENNASKISYFGKELGVELKKAIFSLVRQSAHPLSKLLAKDLFSASHFSIENYTEVVGMGIHGIVNNLFIEIGNAKFLNLEQENSEEKSTNVFIAINRKYYGYFSFSNCYRNGVSELANSLFLQDKKVSVLTGDNENENANLISLLSRKTRLFFNQSPTDKRNYIESLQNKGEKVLMVGDGLNDAGALLQSNVGLSITDNTNAFTPSSDGIIDSSQLTRLPLLLSFSRRAIHIIIVSFVISLIYNFVGLSFAVTGKLSPLIAAILMPISTISLVLFTVFSSSLFAKLNKF